MIDPFHFDCSHLRVSVDLSDVEVFQDTTGFSLPEDYRGLVVNYAECEVRSNFVYGTERGNRVAWGLHLERFFAIPHRDWPSELADVSVGGESEWRSISFGLSLLRRVPWTPHTGWTDSILPIGMCGMPDGGLLCLDFAFHSDAPAVIVVPVVTGPGPDDVGFIPPEFVASSLTEMFERNVQAFDEDFGQYPWERALDLQVESWVPSDEHLRWNEHRDEMFRGSSRS